MSEWFQALQAAFGGPRCTRICSPKHSDASHLFQRNRGSVPLPLTALSGNIEAMAGRSRDADLSNCVCTCPAVTDVISPIHDDVCRPLSFRVRYSTNRPEQALVGVSC